MPRVSLSFVCHDLLNIARKLFLFPSFCVFSALRSIVLFSVGIAGSIGPWNVGLAILVMG